MIVKAIDEGVMEVYVQVSEGKPEQGVWHWVEETFAVEGGRESPQ